MVQVVQGRITVDDHGVHIPVLQEPTRFPGIMLSDHRQEISPELQRSGNIRLPINMPGQVFKVWFGDQYAPGMYFVFFAESAVSKEARLNKGDAKAIIVFRIADGTDVTITFVPVHLVHVRLEQYADFSLHVPKLTNTTPFGLLTGQQDF